MSSMGIVKDDSEVRPIFPVELFHWRSTLSRFLSGRAEKIKEEVPGTSGGRPPLGGAEVGEV